MADYNACPGCGRRAKDALTSNFFPVYRCRDCGREYCKQCASGHCPGCGSDKRTEAGRVYA